MPFVAMPYANRAQKDVLAKKYDVRGIPTLVFLNATGEVVTKDGRSVVMNAHGDVSKILSALKN